MRAHKNFCAAPRSLYRFTSRPTLAERQFGSLQKVIQELSKNFPEARRGGMSKQMKPLYEFGPFRLDYAERRRACGLDPDGLRDPHGAHRAPRPPRGKGGTAPDAMA